MKKILVMFIVLTLLCGCKSEVVNENIESSEVTSAVQAGDYRALLPFEVSSSRIKHAQTSTSLQEAFTIGQGLMNYSKKYFPSNKYAYKEGMFLTYSALDAFDDGMGLLGRTSESNPNGMNPKIGSIFSTNKGDQKIQNNDVLLVDIQELDWYQDKELKGISLAIVLNDEITEHKAIVDENLLKAYGEEAGRKIVNYLRKTHPEIGAKLPIYVALFKESSYNNSLPGVFIEEAYFSSRTTGEYVTIDEAYALFPSNLANSLDSINSIYFERFVASSKQFFPEDTSMIALGYFKDQALTQLNIEVNMHAKTWAEANALIQNINSSLAIFEGNSFAIQVTIYADKELCAALKREINSDKVEALILTK